MSASYASQIFRCWVAGPMTIASAASAQFVKGISGVSMWFIRSPDVQREFYWWVIQFARIKKLNINGNLLSLHFSSLNCANIINIWIILSAVRITMISRTQGFNVFMINYNDSNLAKFGLQSLYTQGSASTNPVWLIDLIT